MRSFGMKLLKAIILCWISDLDLTEERRHQQQFL